MHKRTVAGIRACTWVWLIMMLLTLITWGIGRSGPGGLELSLLVLGFALLKGWMLGEYFMGLKRVRGLWRWPVALWLAVPGGLITTAFVLAN